MTKTNRSRGDTLVEVLIALAVLTTILVGAYITANRSQNTNQASQERGEAIKIVESQIERLKGLLSSGTIVVPAGSFCVNTANSGLTTITAPANPFSESLETATLPYVPADCGNLGGRYNIAIRASSNTYEFLVRWHRIGGSRDQINMYYRVY